MYDEHGNIMTFWQRVCLLRYSFMSWSEYSYYCAMDCDAQGKPIKPTIWDYICCLYQDLVGHHIARLICKIRDHNLVDEGYAGPDSGAMDMRCVRCGQHWHHQLY